MEADSEEPRNEDPAFIQAVFSTATGILQLYGWVILIGILLAYYLYGKLRSYFSHLSQQRQEDQYKRLDTSAAQSRLEAMERSRLRMQAKLDEQAREFAERQKKKEEEKRKERIEDWERHQEGKGYRSKKKAPEERPQAPPTLKPKSKQSLKPEFNPLMGDVGGACFRPARRGGGGG
ncbi:selenoprotein S-like [Physella acuta]|uniref:selenoprotein S-like n=1 Tax=Physella acuta TaxID=109671 RepID=UPI0027DCCAC2|nr:selenoprotein S-like [Physella acuta]